MSLDLRPGSRHAIPIRHPDFPFGDHIPRHWAAGNAFATQVFNATQLTFPDGERFFIRAVNDALPRVQDPELLKQARGFAGQEAVHGKEHERYFDTLRSQGYRIDGFLRRLRRFIGAMDRLPASFRVSLTAALEHYTATLGYFALEDPFAESFDPTMRSLIYWHAAEEVEHKAVAFDVMQAAGIGYLTRVLAFVVATGIFFGWIAAGTRMLLRQDGVTPREIRAMREELKARSDHALVRDTARRVFSYFKPGFHPNQENDIDRAHSRLAEIGLAAGNA